MAKKRKKASKNLGRKQSSCPKKNKQLRVNYLKTIQKLCELSNCADAFKLLTKDERIAIFSRRVYVEPVKKPANPFCLDSDYKYIRGFVATLFASNMLCSKTGEKKKFTNFESFVGHHFFDIINDFSEERKTQLLTAFEPLQNYLGDTMRSINNFCFHYNFLCNSINLYDSVVYSLKLDVKLQKHPTPGICYQSILTATSPRLSDYVDKGNKRKVFQLAYVSPNADLKWMVVPVRKLHGKYKGCKKELPVCIQSHAYHRLFERILPIDSLSAAWHLCFSLENRFDVVVYKGRFLIPFYQWENKCGYFVAVIDKNRLIIKTFLFLTHHNTPEGEKLEEISGLSKEEISYWKIDTLQNFISADLGDNQKILSYLETAGISHLLDVDPMFLDEQDQNTYNWGALNNYIDKGKTELFDEGAEDNAEELPNYFSYECEAQKE